MGVCTIGLLIYLQFKVMGFGLFMLDSKEHKEITIYKLDNKKKLNLSKIDKIFKVQYFVVCLRCSTTFHLILRLDNSQMTPLEIISASGGCSLIWRHADCTFQLHQNESQLRSIQVATLHVQSGFHRLRAFLPFIFFW